MYITIFMLLIVVSAIVCHYVAKSRGANAVRLGVIGAVFGPLAIPFAFLSKPDSNNKDR